MAAQLPDIIKVRHVKYMHVYERTQVRMQMCTCEHVCSSTWYALQQAAASWALWDI